MDIYLTMVFDGNILGTRDKECGSFHGPGIIMRLLLRLEGNSCR